MEDYDTDCPPSTIQSWTRNPTLSFFHRFHTKSLIVMTHTFFHILAHVIINMNKTSSRGQPLLGFQNWTTEQWKKSRVLYISMDQCTCATYLENNWHHDALWEEGKPAQGV